MQTKRINPKQTLAIRSAVLREGLPLPQCQFEGDDDATTIHIGGFIDDDLLAVASVYKQNKPSISEGIGYQLRGMASAKAARGKGLGRMVLNEAEHAAKTVGADYLWANARISALGFYQKAGYEVIGAEFMIQGVGLHRIIMRKL